MTAGERHAIAYHEAGHAVIARVLGVPAGHVTIAADDDSAGHSITYDHFAAMRSWESRGKFRDMTSVVRARIMTIMAGAETEIAMLDSTPEGDGDDRYQISLMMEELPGIDARAASLLDGRLRAKTRFLIARHRAAIERVAAALLSEGTLSSEKADELVGYRQMERPLPFWMVPEE